MERELEIDHTRAHEEDRTVPVVLSTEYAVERNWGTEILDHNPDSVDLSRAPLPLIESHDNQQLNIGIVDDLRVIGKKLRGSLKIGHSARGNEIWEDIKSGIIRNVSIGYEILSRKPEPNGVVRCSFMPYELSLVSTPADPQAGINRSKEKTMSIETKAPRGERKKVENELLAEQERISDIRHIGESLSQSELAETWVSNGDSLAGFKEAVGKRLAETRQPMRTERMTDTNDFLSPQDLQRYSLRKAVLACVDPSKYAREAGFEIEVSNHLAQQRGRETAGILMPLNLPQHQQRDVTYAGTGSNLVGTDHMGGEFVDILRARSTIMRQPITMLNGLRGNVNIPAKTGTSTAYWIDGDGAALTESTPAFGSIALTPKTVGGLVDVTRRTLMQSSPSIDQLIQNDLAAMLAVEIDNKAVNGDGSGSTPTGILSTASIGSTTYANGTTPTYADIVGLEGTIAAANADGGSMAYLVTPALMTALKVTDVGTDTGNFVYSRGNQPGEGSMNGFPSYYSSNIPAGYVIAGNWSDFIFAEWGALEIDVDMYGDNFSKGSVSIRAMMDVDLAVRHAGAFAEIHEAA
jgi:HK97 family phage major capsid protein